MTDNMLLIGVVAIGFFWLIAWMMRNGDYEEQRILGAGVYEVGVEIRPGRCDLVAADGSGSFAVRNKETDAWNMGSPIGVTSGSMPSRFRNLTLNPGDLLQIDGKVSVMLTPPKPIFDLRTETLGPGIYRFGVDVPPAKYDIEVVSGGGEIYLIELGKDTYNLFLQMAKGTAMKPSTYRNVLCSNRYELWINGSLQVKLTPSGRQPLWIFYRKGL